MAANTSKTHRGSRVEKRFAKNHSLTPEQARLRLDESGASLIFQEIPENGAAGAAKDEKPTRRPRKRERGR
jgi:hypothetical protein